MTDQPTDSAVKYGEFPFPLTGGATESRFLTWLRNHSNYMAVGGLLDYLRMAAVLLRGILINNLILLPPLLIAAIVVSMAHGWMLTVYMTPWALALAIAWVLLFPIATMLTKIAGYQKSLASGSDSSVQSRDRYERSFAFALLLVLGVGLLDLLPRLVDFYHDHHPHIGLAWKEYLAAAMAGFGSLSAAPKLLKVLSGAWRKLAMAVIAVGGILAPLFVIIVVSDFLVFVSNESADEKGGYLAWLLVLTPAIYTFGILSAMVIGFFKGTFSGREYRRLSGLLFSVIAIHIVMIAAIVGVFLAVSWYTRNDPRVVAHLSSDLFILACALEIWFFCWLTVDINQTSIHGLYRDRLASAYLLGVNAQGQADIEEDVPLGELAYHVTGSIAPYHLINVALNLQGSEDIGLRDRHSDFFIFSKRFIGGERTGYCRSATMEQVFPQVNLASAMAISAAAASPNMGRSTSPALVAFMTLINVRLGVWVPNPGRLEEELARRTAKGKAARRELAGRLAAPAGEGAGRLQRPGFDFAEVFADELISVQKRWQQLQSARKLVADCWTPATAHGLAGIAFSGGGIRSATINLGIAQALHRAGLFVHFDYMSTVSGGGYLGASISSLMRYKTLPVSEIAGSVAIRSATIKKDAKGPKIVQVTGAGGETRSYRYSRDAELLVKNGDTVKPGTRLVARPGPKLRSEIAGIVGVRVSDRGQQIVSVSGGQPGETHKYEFAKYDELDVTDGESIEAGRLLVKQRNSFSERFRWRVRPHALLLEMTMRLDEHHRWVNLSDGGHIENLATIELLRRRCKVIVIGDGEADPLMHFSGLATLIRTARIDLGVHIDIKLDDLRLDAATGSRNHLAIGRITYPGETEPGYLLYLKSSFSGDEDEVIGEYRHRNPLFPHESTADQFFNEGQFEAYRALGQHIGEHAVAELVPGREADGAIPFDKFSGGFQALWQRTYPEKVSIPEALKADGQVHPPRLKPA